MQFVESETVELKVEVVGDICREVIAFANTRGGVLYIGVRDDGSVVGVENADETMLRLNNTIRDSIKPDVTMFVRYETVIVADRQIVAVTIQKGTDRPYYLGSKGLKPGGVFVRNGTSTDPASDTSIRNMIRETDGDRYEDMRSLEQSLTFVAATEEFAKAGISFEEAKQMTMGLLSMDGVYSNLGLLLSDQCPATVKAAVFDGVDQSQFQDRRAFEGSLFAQMNRLYEWLSLQNRNRATFSGLYRTDMLDYPEEALREAMLNAFVHRDYSYSASVLVSVYTDRIEFVSVGGLLSGIALEDVMMGLSVCRNPKLAAVFYRLKLIEAYGTGIPKMLRAYADSGLEPKLEATPNAFRITLPNRNAMRTQSDVPGQEGKILAYLASHGQLVRSDVDKLLGCSQATSSRILKRLVENGQLCVETVGRGRVYRKKI